MNGAFPYYLVPYANLPYQHPGYKHQYAQYPQQMVAAHPVGGAGGGAGGKYGSYYYQNGLYVPQVFYPVPQGWQGAPLQMQAMAQYSYMGAPWPVAAAAATAASVPQGQGGDVGNVEDSMENLSL